MQGLTNLMNTVGKISPALNLGLGAFGTASNILAQRERNKVYQAALARQRYLENLTPQQHAEGIRSFTRPLSGGLTAGVENLVQAAMGERGLAQSPSIFSEVLAQALAPYQQQEQARATDAWFRSLGLGNDFTELANLAPQPGSNVNLWREILRSFQRPQGTTMPLPLAPAGFSFSDFFGLSPSTPTEPWDIGSFADWFTGTGGSAIPNVTLAGG